MITDLLYSFLRWCPGALGFLLRKKFYPGLFRKCGSGVIFGRFVVFSHPEKISLGDGVVISHRVELRAGGEKEHGEILLGDNVFLGVGTTLETAGGEITLERCANIGSDCTLVGTGNLRIGSDVLVAAFCKIGVIDSHDKGVAPYQKSSAIKIGNGAWLGARCSVNEPSEIGAGTIIGAHGVVVGDIESNTIATGNPARIKRRR